ncbi:Hypothetical predicted protein [Mytilus galloprovincialis]|uniref:Uncharacterized protein n=1 Tax=Mytilus galloprovincialis TaxID=29158 RepID=A0A8B6ETR2_MYTGA|nr:Hypothetical predicted protein [Mytilus galloprovincialis]
MAFDAGKFLKTPDLEGFDNLKKEELVLLAKHLKLNFKVENVDAFKLKQLELEHELKLKETGMKEMEKIKVKELEMKERLEMDKKEKEDEFRLKELEMRERLEMAKIKIEIVKEESNTKVQSKSDHFDAPKNIRLVPKFEKSSDYDTVKQEVLKAYELVPEAYRQKFRSYKKFDSQTYVEFAREKEDLFDKWLTSKKQITI